MYIVHKYLHCGAKANFTDIDITPRECMTSLLPELYFNEKSRGEKTELHQRFEMRTKRNIRYYLRHLIGVHFGY